MALLTSVALRSVQKKRGFTLTEMSIVLGIIGLIIAGIWSAVTAVHNQRMISKEMNDLLTIVAGVQSMYSGREFTDVAFTDLAPILYTNKIIPPDLAYENGHPLDREGGIIKVEADSNSPAASPHVFEIEFFGTPISCPYLLWLMSNQKGSMRPLYVYDNVHGWVLPTAVKATSFSGCSYASFAFSLQ